MQATQQKLRGYLHHFTMDSQTRTRGMLALNRAQHCYKTFVH